MESTRTRFQSIGTTESTGCEENTTINRLAMLLILPLCVSEILLPCCNCRGVKAAHRMCICWWIPDVCLKSHCDWSRSYIKKPITTFRMKYENNLHNGKAQMSGEDQWRSSKSNHLLMSLSAFVQRNYVFALRRSVAPRRNSTVHGKPGRHKVHQLLYRNIRVLLGTYCRVTWDDRIN